MTIDFHTHVFPQHIASAALKKLSLASHTPPFSQGTEAALLASMARAGIDCAVLLPVATNPLKVSSMNRSLSQPREDFRLIPFGAMHPEMEQPLEELKQLRAWGVRGIKLHPVYQGIDMDDIRTLRILDGAAALGMYTVVHAGDDIGYPGVSRSSPEQILSALKQVGKTNLILAHMGGWKRWDEVLPLAQYGVYLDTSFSLGEIPGTYYSPEEKRLLSPKDFCSLVHAFGADRILFGTDSPWTDQKKSVEEILQLDLTEEEKEKILFRNGEAILFSNP